MSEKTLTEVDIAMIRALLEEHKEAMKCPCRFTTEEVYAIKSYLESLKAIRAELRKIIIGVIVTGVGFVFYLFYTLKGGK